MENLDSAKFVMGLLSCRGRMTLPDTFVKGVISSITLSKSTSTLEMSRYSNDRMSAMPKKGNPPSHDKACDFVEDFLKKNMSDGDLGSVIIEQEWLQRFDEPFISKHKMRASKQRTFFGHSYDLCVRHLFTNYVLMVIEIGAIGDDTKHNPDHPDQLIDDGIAKDWIEMHYPLANFYRINKEDALIQSHLRKVFGMEDKSN